MKHLVRSPKTVTIALLAVAAVIAITTHRAQAIDQDIAKLNRFMQATKGNTASMQVFREGRDFIEAQNWQKAAEKFNDFIKGFPKDKDMDAALYWYGYALEKQNRKEEAKVPLTRLVQRYRNSSWRQEALALLVVLGEKALVDQELIKENCEIKILALQSLFQADEERAIALVTESIKGSPPPQCQGFQAAALSMLGSHGGARVVPLLLDIARNNPDQKLRLTAIRRLGEQHNDQVTDELIKIYDADKTKEVRVQVLRALVESRTTRGSAKVLEIARTGDDIAMRQVAIRYIGELDDAASLDELIRIFDADKTQDIRYQIIRALADRDDAKARTKLLEIARTGATPEERIEAIRRLGDHNRLSMDELMQLYTSETSLPIKQGLLRAFSNSNDPRAQAKLMEIARGNDAIELRMYAIRQLGEKDDEQTINQL
ncbi:MAG TPA: HEAT repeat domain-containing protein, partial [Pyrinomonadaceae bacterium]|nr:HEAT repeat domain-containing protein [Pyrinomonadaceae bacterium]